MHDYYGAGVDLYDLQHDTYADDLSFYVALASHLGLRPGDAVLELACGTGRLLAPLLAAGYRVAGIDREEATLARARIRLAAWADTLLLVRADMRDYRVDRQFRLAVLGLNALQHLLTAEDQLACLRCTRRHLAAGGVLAIDLQNPLSFLGGAEGDVLRHRFTAAHPETGETIMQFGMERVDEAAQTITVSLMTDTIGAGGVVTRRLSTLDLRLVFRFELEALLREAGFSPQGCYGTYELDPYTSTAPSLIVVARAV